MPWARRAAFSDYRRLTEPRQIQTGEVACIGKWRRQAGLKFGRREVQKTVGRAIGEGSMNSFPGRTVYGGAIRTGGLASVEMALRRQEKFKRHE